MKCNKCGFENPDSAKFCNWCGEKLDAFSEQESPKEEKASKSCQICGTVNEADAKYCAVCGSQLSSTVQEKPVYTQIQTQNQGMYVDSQDRFGTSSMVVGIVSLVSSLTCCLFALGLIGGVVAIVFSAISFKKNQGNQSKAVVGLVCGCIAALIGLILLISVIAAMNDPEMLKEIQNMLEQSGVY